MIEPYYSEPGITLYHGDCREILPQLEHAVQCCVTSPPYWGLRDYGVDGQLGLEETPEEYTKRMTDVFRAVSDILHKNGTLWLNLGDSYAGSNTTLKWREGSARADGSIREDGHLRRNRNGTGYIPGLKPKDLMGIPWRVAFALQAAGWYLRSDIIWSKPNPMPESVTDRPTKAHEYIFLMSKSERYYYDHEAIKEPAQDYGKRDRTGWSRRIHAEQMGQRPQMGGHKCDFKESGRNKRSIWKSDENPSHELLAWLVLNHPRIISEYFTGEKPDVWEVCTKPYPGAHFAVFPPELIEPCILAGTKEGDIVLDPFSGSATVGQVCKKHRRRYIGIELNEEYLKLSPDRIGRQGVLL